MLNIPEVFEILMNSNKISWILTELWSEKIEWFGPSPIEPFNLALDGRPVRGSLGPHVGHVGAVVAHVAAVEPMFSLFYSKLLANCLQTLRGSFSAVSKPNFASKYSL